jgi:hypothetical protein
MRNCFRILEGSFLMWNALGKMLGEAWHEYFSCDVMSCVGNEWHIMFII